MSEFPKMLTHKNTLELPSSKNPNVLVARAKEEIARREFQKDRVLTPAQIQEKNAVIARGLVAEARMGQAKINTDETNNLENNRQSLENTLAAQNAREAEQLAANKALFQKIMDKSSNVVIPDKIKAQDEIDTTKTNPVYFNRGTNGASIGVAPKHVPVTEVSESLKTQNLTDKVKAFGKKVASWFGAK
jgi:4-hydroxy-L-threonine phosphate dehydrogenase PdxA